MTSTRGRFLAGAGLALCAVSPLLAGSEAPYDPPTQVAVRSEYQPAAGGTVPAPAHVVRALVGPGRFQVSAQPSTPSLPHSCSWTAHPKESRQCRPAGCFQQARARSSGGQPGLGALSTSLTMVDTGVCCPASQARWKASGVRLAFTLPSSAS